MTVEDASRVVRVFVSSPSDVAPERGRVQAVAAKLNREYEGLIRFETVLWEEHFYKADRSFQPQINRIVQPDACDVLVSIFWTRVGTELPADFARMPNGKPYPSGTAYELLTALEASKSKGIPDVYVFRKTADAALPTADLERRRQAQTQLDALEAFWSEWFKSEHGHFKAAFHTFGGTDEFESQIEDLLRQWLHSQHLLGPRLKWPKEKGSPFPGLAPFEVEQAAVFFGRDRAIDEARRRLVAAGENGTPFLLIVGASGSGKSSLARAGLISRLTTPGIIETIDLWRVARMKPSEGQSSPVSLLATALFAALPELARGDFPSADMLADHLRRGGAAAAQPIIRALARVAEAEGQERHSGQPLRAALVLLIDQLEELFAQAVGDDERAAFAQAVKELAATGAVWCIATLRADLYELLLRQPVLEKLKECGATLDLSPPGAAELAEIVHAPAAASGLSFEHSGEKGALDERLLADAKSADSLPLLQFTLRDLYEKRVEADGEARLTHAAYDALGGLQGAIAAEAERAAANLPAGTLDALPRLLRRLAEPARDGKSFTLRAAERADIAAQSEEAALADALLGARIIIAGTNADGRPTLRLAHDAVLTAWPRAAEAAQASRVFYRVRAEVEDALRRWQEHGQPKDRLIPRGVPLAEAEKLAGDFARELPVELIAYVNASRRHARLRQRLVAAAAVFFLALAVAATGAGLWAYREQQRAEVTLAAATQTANSLVFDLAQRFKDTVGISASLIKAILDKARALQEQLIESGQATPDLEYSEAAALIETVDSRLRIGDTEGAFGAAEKAQQILADLLRRNPSNTDYQEQLSVADEKVGNVQVAQGNLADAMTSYKAEFTTLDHLAKSDPSHLAWQDDLSGAYDKIGDLRVLQGNLADALTSFQSGLAIKEALAKSDPANADWQDDLSGSYIRVGDVEVAQGKLADALGFYRASLAISEVLETSNPNNSRWQDNLAGLYVRIGRVQMVQSDLASALKSYQASLAIAQRLAQSDPGNSDWQHEIAVSNDKIGDVQQAQGKLGEALSSYQAMFAIVDRLAKSDPSNASWQRDLSVSYEMVGDVQAAQGNLADGLASYRADLGIIQRMVNSDPGNARWQRDLVAAYERVGGVQMTQGDLEGALTSYQESLAIAERLTKSDQSNTESQRDRALLHEKLGEVQQAQGKLADALASYQTSLAIMQNLAQSDASNTDWQRDLARSYEKVGDVLVAQLELSDAFASYQASLAIRVQLADADPGNPGRQDDLSAAYEKVGDVQKAQDDLVAALKSYEASLSIIRGLAQSDPENSDWQDNLAMSYEKVGDVQKAQGNPAGALDSYQADLAITQRLAQSNPGNTRWQRNLSATFNEIGEVLGSQGNLKDAIASYRNALAILQALVGRDNSNADWLKGFAISASSIAWYSLLTHDFTTSLEAADQSISIEPNLIWLNTNRAHALMFLNRTSEARALYLKYRDQKNVQGGKSWPAVILDDFAELRKAGLSKPLMDEIEKNFKAAG